MIEVISSRCIYMQLCILYKCALIFFLRIRYYFKNLYYISIYLHSCMQLCLWTKALQKTMLAFSISVSGSTVNGWMWSLMTTYQLGLANWSLCTQTTLVSFGPHFSKKPMPNCTEVMKPSKVAPLWRLW